MTFITVTEGTVSFRIKVSPEMAPVVQVVAYTILSSETVIADNADFSTEKCFSNKVSKMRGDLIFGFTDQEVPTKQI